MGILFPLVREVFPNTFLYDFTASYFLTVRKIKKTKVEGDDYVAEKDRLRKHDIRIKVTEEEYLIAKHKAELANMYVSQFIRRAIFKTEIKVTKIPFEAISYLSDVINDNKQIFWRLGSNINQIAKVIHENNDTYSKEQMRQVLIDLQNTYNQYEKLCGIMMSRLYGLDD